MNDLARAATASPAADAVTSAVVRESFGSIVREMRRSMVRSVTPCSSAMAFIMA